jgi:hypothetical protein
MCRSSSLSRALMYCSVLDWLMSIQTGEAKRCHISTGKLSCVCVTGSGFSPGLRMMTR